MSSVPFFQRALIFFFILLTAVAQPLRFNIGGPSFEAINFAEDPQLNLLSPNTAIISLPPSTVPLNSSWQPIYDTYRYALGGNIGYRIPVAPGMYSVAVGFAETYHPNFQAGKRQFDLLINGVPRFNRLDVFATVGANSPMYLRTDNIPDRNGTITIVVRRISSRENPMLSALVILPTPTSPLGSA